MPTPYDPIKQNILYPLDNPDYANRSAMSDIGINPYSANPFSQAVGKLGASQRNTYLSQMASDNDINDVNPAAIANQGAGGRGSAVAFSDYLRNSLSGRQVGPTYDGRTENGLDGSRGLSQNIKNASQSFATPNYGTQGQFPGTIQKIRDYRNSLNAGTANFSNINPFVVALSDQLGANGGLGTADFLADMYQPFLAPSMANAYRRSLNASGEQAIRSMANEPLTSNKDIWSYLMGY